MSFAMKLVQFLFGSVGVVAECTWSNASLACCQKARLHTRLSTGLRSSNLSFICVISKIYYLSATINCRQDSQGKAGKAEKEECRSTAPRCFS
jgi:hypothetical protein